MRAYNGKIKISKTKEKALRKLLALSNVFYNDMLAIALEAADCDTILAKEDLTNFEQGSRIYPDVPSDIKNKICQRVALAISRWKFPDATGKRFGRPRFKSPDKKRMSGSFSVRDSQANAVLTTKTRRGHVVAQIHVPNFGVVKARMDDSEIQGTIKQICVKQDACGDFWVSITTDYDDCQLLPEPQAAAGGVDLGLKHTAFAAGKTESGEVVPLDSGRGAFLQKNMSKLVNASQAKNYFGLAHIHRKIARQRKDFNRKLAHNICLNFKTIFVGDVNAKWLFSGRLARSAADAAHYQLKTFIAAKASKTGRKYIEVKEKYSSLVCNSCKKWNGVCSLADRDISCPNCGASCHRDMNAALNICEIGLGTFEFDLKSIPAKAVRDRLAKEKRRAATPQGMPADHASEASKSPQAPSS